MSTKELWETCANFNNNTEIRLFSTMGDFLIGLQICGIHKMADFRTSILQNGDNSPLLHTEIDTFTIDTYKNILYIILKEG